MQKILQETFERFFRSLNQYQHYGKVVNYLYVIAGNACKDYYKKNREVLYEELPEEAISNMDYLEERIDMENALNWLPVELKEVAILFFFQEIKQKEISKILGIGLPLVKYRIKKSKDLLSTYLRKEDSS